MIVLDNVSKKLGKGALTKVVFRDLTITLPTDQRVAILGLPGSGKTCDGVCDGTVRLQS